MPERLSVCLNVQPHPIDDRHARVGRLRESGEAFVIVDWRLFEDTGDVRPGRKGPLLFETRAHAEDTVREREQSFLGARRAVTADDPVATTCRVDGHSPNLYPMRMPYVRGSMYVSPTVPLGPVAY